ncbi:MAG: exodeoxyribonuclease VII small subunit [Lachnospiraceae bacterium]|nr:exodeoxyribonuclease VII small subunit [Lachnospiraceae bacterium]
MADKNKERASIEESFEALEALLEKMQQEETSLEEAFTCYEEGMKLLKHCNETIDKVEKKVQKIAEDGVLEDFT